MFTGAKGGILPLCASALHRRDRSGWRPEAPRATLANQ
jgi:hypothetical protein